MKTSLLFFSVAFCFFVVFMFPTGDAIAQIQFQRAVGGPGSDFAYSIVQTTDGGYAVAGYTQSFGAGSYDMYIVKLNSSGTVQWTRTVGGTNSDFAYSIVQTTDGGCAVAGQTLSFGAGDYDMYIVKLNSSGTVQWSRTVGGTDWDYAYSIVQTTDGGYAVAGTTSSFGPGNEDVYIVKLDASGTVQWSKTVGGTGEDYAYSIVQTTDGGYAVACYTISFGAGGDMYIVKLDASGGLQWTRTVGGPGVDNAYSIVQTTDGGYAVAGVTNSFGAGDYDMYIVKLNSSGTVQWSRTVGGTDWDIAYSIVQTTDGGYAVVGSTKSFGAGNYDMYIIKFNSSGTLQWSRTVGGTAYDEVFSIVRTSDGGYAMAGYTYSFGAGNDDMYIVKLDANGNTCGSTSSPTSSSGTGGTTSTGGNTTSPTSTVTSPTSLTNTGGTLTNICTTIGIQPESNEVPAFYKLYQNYPNPFNPTTRIRFALPKGSLARLVVYDILGREVARLVDEYLHLGSYEIEWNASDYPSGVYYYQLKAGEYTETKKMILTK